MNFKNQSELNKQFKIEINKTPKDYDKMMSLVSMGADPNITDKNKISLLMHIFSLNDKKTIKQYVKFLLEKNINVNLIDKNDMSALLATIYTDNYEMTKLLLEKGADVSKSMSSLIIACQTGNLKIVKLLLKYGADLSYINQIGFNALMKACQFGYLQIVKLLLKYGADLSYINHYGKNALFYACDNNYFDIIKILLNKGINYSVIDKYGKTAIEYITDENVKQFVQQYISKQKSSKTSKK
jgi:ankyrin repeat protein